MNDIFSEQAMIARYRAEDGHPTIPGWRGLVFRVGVRFMKWTYSIFIGLLRRFAHESEDWPHGPLARYLDGRD